MNNQRKKKGLLNPWLLKMAWRDSRTHRKRLFLFMTSIVLGVASLVSIGSFGENLQQAIEGQAKTLLGADLMISSRQPFAPELESLLDSLGGEQARETMFRSMAYFPKTGDTRLVQVRAIKGEFPFYGAMGTRPASAKDTYQSGANALVDGTLMIQYNVAVHDSVRIGARTFKVAGEITKLPSNPPVASTFNPRIYIPDDYLDKTGLLQRGSLVDYRAYFKFDDNRDVEALVTQIEPQINHHRLRYDTVEERKEDVGETLSNFYSFLNLVGFVALILGSIGVGSAVHVYTKQKLGNASILRCVGLESRETFFIYLVQVGVMAFTGSVLGAVLGLMLQLILPQVFRDFLPVNIEHFVAWSAVAKGVAIGLGLAMLFALLPLMSMRKVSPLLALRASFEEEKGGRDRIRWILYVAIVVAIGLFAVSQTEEVSVGLSFTLATVVAFAVLASMAKLITVSFKKFFPRSWTYVWRQGLANLYRPQNQTLVLMLSIGLGTFLITTLYLSHNALLNKVTFVGRGDRPNLVLFDIQTDQRDEISAIVQSHNMPVLQAAPMITMRISELKGESVEEILSDSTRRSGRGLLRWEYRTTYRDSLWDSEKLVDGEWVGQVTADELVIPISMEDGAARRMEVSVGDTITWNVQGVPLTTRVASLRTVDWQRVQANFMVVFPTGVLEAAPQIYVMATKAPTMKQSAILQREIVRKFPNVSMIDLALILNTIDSFLEKISFVIRFMAFFSILTGLVVLAAAVITSRFQRVQESVLLRTLGASRKQVVRIMVVEYIFLGGLAALTGLLLSYVGSWALAFFVFDTPFMPTVLPFIIVLLSVIGLTILIGMANSRGILDRPPLEVLRAEA